MALLHDPKGVWDPEIRRDVTSNVRNTMRGELLGIVAMRTLGLELQADDPTARFRSGSGVVSPRAFGHPAPSARWPGQTRTLDSPSRTSRTAAT